MNYQIIEENSIITAYSVIEKNHRHEYEHEMAYGLLKQVVKECFGEIFQDQDIKKGPYGKPYFADSGIQFNISHCRGMVVCAVSREWELGIDVENIRPFKEAVARRIMSEREFQELLVSPDQNKFFFRAWTYKESVVKLSGNGIRGSLSKIDSGDENYLITRYEIQNGEEIFLISLARGKKNNIVY